MDMYTLARPNLVYGNGGIYTSSLFIPRYTNPVALQVLYALNQESNLSQSISILISNSAYLFDIVCTVHRIAMCM